MKNNNKALKMIKSIILNLICVVITVSSIFPLFWMIYTSFKTKGEFIRSTLSLPTSIKFDNYVKAFEIGDLWTALGNSVINVVVNVIVVAAFATVSGYFFSRYNFKGKKLIYGCYLVGFLIPIYGLLVPVFMQYKLLDMINKRSALWISYYAMQIPLSIFLVESFVKGIPRELEEAAAISGCTLWQTIWKIIFPLCVPVIATVAILTALATWNEFGFATVLITQPELRTIPIAVKMFSSGKNFEYTYMIAALCSASIPIIAVYLFFSKQIINGFTSSGLKG